MQGENSEPWVVGYTVPTWDDVVKRAVAEYPAYFKPRVVDPLLEQYQDQSEELAKREREKENSGMPTRSTSSTTKDAEYLRKKAMEMNKDSSAEPPSK